MQRVSDLSAVLLGLHDKPLLGPKPDQLLIFKRPQLAIKLQALMQPASSAAAKHANNNLVNQAIAAMYQHPLLHEHVVGWAPMRSGQHSAEVHLCFRDASAQHRQQLAATGSIQLTMHGAAAPVSLPVSTVAARQLPDVTLVRMHNVPGGINVHGLMGALLEHFQFGPGYSVLSEYGGDACGDIAAVTPLWCRSDVCIAELRAPVHDAKLSKLPSAFTCFGQQVSVSVQPSILAKAHAYQQLAQAQPTEVLSPASVQSPRQKRRRAQKARAQQAALRQHPQQHQQQHLQLLQSRFTPAIAAQDSLPAGGRLALSRALDPVSDLGGQHGRAGLGHSATVPMQVEQVQPPLDQVSPLAVHALETASALNNGVAPMQTSAAQPDSDASALSQSMVDASMPQAAPPPLPPLPKDFPDNPTASAMFLWAEDHELSVLDARQAVLHLHQHNAQELAQHASGSHVSLPEPIQALLVQTVRSLTGNASFASHLTEPQAAAVAASPSASTSPSASATATCNQPTTPRRSGRVRQPVSEYWKTPPAAPGGAQ